MKRLITNVLTVALVAGLAIVVASAQGTSTGTGSTAAKQNPPAKPPASKPAPETKPAPAKPATIDINSASKAELAAIPGIGDVLADKIIAGRPYKAKTELKSKKILTASVYDKIQTRLVAKQAK